MNKALLLDQYSLSELGADRGLGRYATMIDAAVSELQDLQLSKLRRNPTKVRQPDVLQVQRSIRRMRLDSRIPYHSTSVYHLPLVKNRPWICSVQDVIPLDLKDYTKLGVKSKLLFANARRSDIILANSAYTKSRVGIKMGIHDERIATCPLPISSAFNAAPSLSALSYVSALLENEGIVRGGPFVVALADMRTPDPRKRYHWINPVAKKLKEYNIATVLTGRGLSSAQFPQANVIESLDDERLSALYSLATAMYYPTAYEGQGLPPQEAMASGCPVIAYSNTSVAEVVESAEFLLPDPVPWELQELSAPLPAIACADVVQRIHEWASSPEKLSAARGTARNIAAKYNWQAFSATLSDFYNSYFEGRNR